MVNRCFPCKMQGVFSGVAATKNFFMDRLHLLDFFGKGLCRFPVKMLQRQYHVPIMFVSGLYQVFLQSMTYFPICRKCRITDFPFFSKTSPNVCHFGLPVRSNYRGKNSYPDFLIIQTIPGKADNYRLLSKKSRDNFFKKGRYQTAQMQMR